MPHDRPPRHITEEQLATLTAGLLADANAACVRWLEVQRHAVDWARHYPTGGTEPVGGSHITDPMAERIATEIDNGRAVIDPAKVAIEWLWEMVNISQRLQLMRRQAELMVPKQPELQRESDIGKCECCERDVAKTAADPLRSGMCGACYKSWKRSGDERNRFIAQRRRQRGVGLQASA